MKCEICKENEGLKRGNDKKVICKDCFKELKLKLIKNKANDK